MKIDYIDGFSDSIVLIYGMENIIVSATNLYALRSVVKLVCNRKYFKAIIIGCSMISSITYHLLEHSKHDMPSFRRVKDKKTRKDTFIC